MTKNWIHLDGGVSLRPLETVDFTARYLSWFTDPEVTRFLDARNIKREDAEAHLNEGMRSGRWKMYAICPTDSGVHIGNLKIGPVQERHGLSDMVTVIGDRSAWGKGYGRAAIRGGIRIAFEEMNIRKLSASIDSDNTGSIRAYTAAGFEVEAELPGHFLHDDRTTGKVYVGCFNECWRPGKVTL